MKTTSPKTTQNAFKEVFDSIENLKQAIQNLIESNTHQQNIQSLKDSQRLLKGVAGGIKISHERFRKIKTSGQKKVARKAKAQINRRHSAK